MMNSPPYDWYVLDVNKGIGCALSARVGVKPPPFDAQVYNSTWIRRDAARGLTNSGARMPRLFSKKGQEFKSPYR